MSQSRDECSRILVLDEEYLTDLLSTSLRFQGFEVAIAGNGFDACACPKLCREPVTRRFASGSHVSSGPRTPCTWGVCRPSDTTSNPRGD